MPGLKTPRDLVEQYRTVRGLSAQICEPLEAEDYIIQSMPDVSPPKWHLAHTTWFFEAFLLSRFKPGFKPFDERFHFLFNSYYKSLGPHLERSHRGLLSRPGLPVILKYRAAIDDEVCELLESTTLMGDKKKHKEIEAVIELGLQHEQQHQELLITDIKHILCANPLTPAYIPRSVPDPCLKHGTSASWVEFHEGLRTIGTSSSAFAYDNERPEHQVYLETFQLSSRLVTNGEFTEFIEEGGYANPLHWLSAGWETLLKEEWEAPLYWKNQNGRWWVATLNGVEPVNPLEPVCHVSFYEADAYANWKGARLATEAEWEVASRILPQSSIGRGNFLESGNLRPLPALSAPHENQGLQQLFGDVWEWTSSAYLPYPGFQPLLGSAGEYNGKFMSNQMVLKGGSCATPCSHIRPTYRNFFPPHSRWQFTGIRLAKRNPR